jgi:hypothetical protein
MYNIVNQCIEIEKQIGVREDGEVVYMKPTHLLLTKDHYKKILKTVGINSDNLPVPMTELYGLELVFTDVPLEEPRVLSM